MKLALHFPRFGPYHLARLKGAVQAFSAAGHEVFGLEVAGLDNTYRWERAEPPDGLRKETAFPGDVYERIEPGRLADGLESLLNRMKPDVLAVCGYRSKDSAIVADWGRRNGAKLILMTETKEDDKTRLTWVESAKRLYLRRFQAAFCGGLPHRRYLERLGFSTEAVFEVYDVVDNERFAREAAQFHGVMDASLRRRLGIPDRPFFLASNRFIARKNLGGLVEAYAEYRREAPSGWDLVLLGDGELAPALRRQVTALGLEQHVHFPGFRQIGELPAYYAAAAAFIHPAHNEPWGLVVNEAMACGLPVIVSGTSGCAADLVVDGRNGYVVNSLSVRDMALAMRNVASGPERRQAMGEASRRIIAHFTPERFGLELLAAARHATRPAETRRRGISAISSPSLIGVGLNGNPLALMPRDVLQHHRDPFQWILGRSFRRQLLRAGLRVLGELEFFLPPPVLEADVATSLGVPRELLDRIIPHLCRRLGVSSDRFVVTFPAEPSRERAYLYLMDQTYQPRFFVKLGLSTKGLLPLQREAEFLLQLSPLKGKPFATPRLVDMNLEDSLPFLAFEYGDYIRHVAYTRWDGVPADISRFLTSLGRRTVAGGELHWLPERKFPCLSTALRELVQEAPTRRWDVAPGHGDLTNWNLFEVGGKLVLADWEYSGPSLPVGTDRLCFHLSHIIRLAMARPERAVALLRSQLAWEQLDAKDRDQYNMGLLYLCAAGNSAARRVARHWS